MPNIARLLKSEISRVARREVRSETQLLKKTVSAYRSEIAALKRRARAMEQQLRTLGKIHAKATPIAASDAANSEAQRYSAKGLASLRRRLGLSASELGLLVGASAQSIYNWEAGNVKPLAKHRAAIADLKAIGKREAAARLAAQG